MKTKLKYTKIEPNKYRVWVPFGQCVGTVHRSWDNLWDGRGTTGLCSWSVQHCYTRQRAAEALAAMFNGLRELSYDRG